MPAKLARRGPDGPEPGGFVVAATGESAGWVGVPCALVSGRPAGVHRHESDDHAVLFHLRGTARVEVVRGDRLTRALVQPGGVSVLPAGRAYEVRLDRPVEALALAIAPGALAQIVARGWSGATPPADPVEAIDRRDSALWALGKQLADRLRAPRPGSQLYAEALAVQVALRLLWSGPVSDARAAAIDDARVRQAVDYIRVGLGGEITTNELAEVSGLSPGYFAGAFKRALGMTPHQYLVEQRVERACELLEDPHRPIIDVALEVGFSSQSHLTSVFRKLKKTTPAAYRQDALGLGRD